jgi:hypothetical protein
MRELYNLAASPIGNGDETGTYGDHGFLCVFWTPSCVKCRGSCLVKLNCKNLGEFFNAKRANGHCQTSEQSLGIFSLLFIDA